MADYITKPINPDLVNLRVRNHLKLKLQRDQLKKQRDILQRQRIDLEGTLARIKRLEGLIHICMYCKKICNEEEVWEQMENISQSTQTPCSATASVLIVLMSSKNQCH